ncbi:MAG: NAD(P)-dependent oxidoreductase [Planctomycetota bacterium]|nr:NAD(P)-dependent oxidoreductase [Planctomycetota bacterium]
MLNPGTLNFDGRLSFESLQAAVAVHVLPNDVIDSERVKRAQGCEILISKELPFPKGVIEGLPDEVRLICEAGTGVDNIDVGAAKKKNIIVCNVPDYSTSSVAQLTMSFILALSTGMQRLIRNVAVRDLADFQAQLRYLHSEVEGKTLGVIGAGAIGERVIRFARAFDMTVRVYNPSPRSWPDKKIKQVEFEEVLEASHFVSLHRPYENDSAPLIRTETIGHMKQRPYLVNTARGRLVNHEDLAEALKSGQLAGAALDVQHPEPLPEDHELWSMANVILTPHIGWKSIEARKRLVKKLGENIKAFLSGTPINVVKPS